jgi:hypothetical protein
MIKNIFAMIVLVLAFVAILTPVLVGAQESVPGGSLEVVRGSLDGDQKGTVAASFLGFGLLILIGIGVPTAVSFGFRHLLKSNLKTYAATYVFVVLCYVLANVTIEGTPSGSIPMTGLMLLIPAMLGSLLAQTMYLLRLPKKKIE